MVVNNKKNSLSLWGNNRGLLLLCMLLLCVGCGNKTSRSGDKDTIALKAAPMFDADSAFYFVERQCEFGARVPGSEAHSNCGDWLEATFKRYGCEVKSQRSTVKGQGGKEWPMRNIIAHLPAQNAEAPTLLFTAHWDSRTWADNDADKTYHNTPVLAANDGASGVAVLLEMARALQMTNRSCHIDFVCFDVEDQGGREDEDDDGDDDGGLMGYWCLGSQYWAEQAFIEGYRARWGVNLDMVGGKGSKFRKESVSLYFASGLVDQVWRLARQMGYGAYFVDEEGGSVTDDHLPVNRVARIPAINIIPNTDYADSSFGPTWHTHNDTPENIDKAVLKAVGQVLVQLVVNS